MLNLKSSDVTDYPYPHAISDAILPPDLFVRLKADYPDARTFLETSNETSGVGSRAGKGKGFDIYRGDAAYANLIRDSVAWAEFDHWINSSAFVDKYQELFAAYADRMGILADVDPARYDRAYIEPRDRLTERETPAERLLRLAHRATRRWKRRQSVSLFSRLDITRSTGGYAKMPHCDRPNRLCSLIVYFTNAKDVGLQGGELMIYRAKSPTDIEKARRYPRPGDVEIVARVTPQENRGVFFPCCNNSYHGVTAVTSEGVCRDFLYINISGHASNVW
jgi:hypothetical protein